MPELTPIDKPEAAATKKFMIACISDKNVAQLRVWPLIRPYAVEIINRVKGEYTLDVLWAHTVGKMNTDIFVAYNLPFEGEPTAVQMWEQVMARLISKSAGDDFVGFVIREWLMDRSTFNLWQAYIKPEFQKTTAFRQGIEWFRKDAQSCGVQKLTCSTYDPEMVELIKHAGFTQGRTDFFMEIPKG